MCFQGKSGFGMYGRCVCTLDSLLCVAHYSPLLALSVVSAHLTTGEQVHWSVCDLVS